MVLLLRNFPCWLSFPFLQPDIVKYFDDKPIFHSFWEISWSTSSIVCFTFLRFDLNKWWDPQKIQLIQGYQRIDGVTQHHSFTIRIQWNLFKAGTLRTNILSALDMRPI